MRLVKNTIIKLPLCYFIFYLLKDMKYTKNICKKGVFHKQDYNKKELQITLKSL